MQELSNRLLVSDIPSPVSLYGAYTPPVERSRAVYDGTHLTTFLAAHGGQPLQYREFLRENRVGNVFRELEQGITVAVPQK